MLERIYEKENSLILNVEDISNYYNYMALARCIAGIEVQGGKRAFPTADQSCRAYSLIKNHSSSSYAFDRRGEKKITRKGSKKCKPCKLINIKTNEEILCNSFSEAADVCGVKQSYVSQAIILGYKIKREWIIKRI